MVRRDLHNIVVPVDLTDREDIQLVVQTLQTFVLRRIPVRFGFVPTAFSTDSFQQVKVVHYLQDTFGLSGVLQYLDEVSSFRTP